jgi:tryptophan synthase alpha subunit
MTNASGAIVGSKFIKLLDKSKNPEEAVTDLLKTLNYMIIRIYT